jgi:PKD repeat protein
METGSGPASGGTRVIIHGSGFDEPVAVSFHFPAANVSVAQLVLSVTGTEIVILTSAAPLPSQCPTNGIVSSDSVRVVNIETGDSDDAPIGFNFVLPVPQITGVNPGGGGTGSTLTINGRNFSNSVEVTFGSGTSGSSAQVQSVSPGAVTVIVPNPPQGFTFNTQPCGNNGVQNVPTPIDVTVRDLASQCTATFRNGFLLAPSDTSCRNQTPGTPPTANFSFFVVNAATHTVQFTDTSTGSPTTWQWDFTNDGTFDTTTQNPQFSYSTAGTYAVRLRVSNAAGSNEVVKQVTVP